MFIFTKKGRVAYLNFVRNLPSQVLLFSPCVFLPMGGVLSVKNPVDLAVWCVLFAMFLFAFNANIMEFIDEALSGDQGKKQDDEAIVKRSGWRLVLSTLRQQPLKVIGFFFVILATYGGLITVVTVVLWNNGIRP